MTPDTTAGRIDAAARACHRARRGAAAAGVLLRGGEPGAARDRIEAAEQAADNALGFLLAAGAADPGKPQGDPYALPARRPDTANGRELLAALGTARWLAERLDRERGDLRDGEPCNWAETPENLALKLRVEIHGPAGGGRE